MLKYFHLFLIFILLLIYIKVFASLPQGRSWGFRKESSGPVSRVLCPPRRVPAIYLRRRSRGASIVLPSGSGGQPSLTLTPSGGRSRRVAGIRELSTSGVHSPHVTIRLVGSCPTFSPLPSIRKHTLLLSVEGGCFLLHVQALADFYPLGSGVPCVARTFLSLVSKGDLPAASRSTAFWSCKGTEKFKV